MRLPAPGMAAIIQLHRRFIDAASSNPNPWLLHKRQVALVLKDMLPWLDAKVIDRLNVAFDPQRSGVIRYIRLSVALVAGTRPAMTELMALVNKGKNLNSKFSSEQFLLRLIFNMYEECDGSVAGETIADGQNNKGIRMEDIVEALSCCSCSVDEQIRISNIGNKIVQYFFEKLRNADISYDEEAEDVKSAMGDYKTDDNIEANEDFDVHGGLISPAMSGPLTKDFYGRVTRTATAQQRIRDATHKWGLPLPTAHLNYLRERQSRDLVDQHQHNLEIQYRQQLRQQQSVAADLAVQDSISVQDGHSVTTVATAERSLFPGGQSVWTETPSQEFSSYAKSADRNKPASSIFDTKDTQKLSADKFLRYSKLRSIRTFPKIPQQDILACLNDLYPEVLVEFSRQVQRFRSLIFPYSITGSITFEDSVMMNSSYGTDVSSQRGDGVDSLFFGDSVDFDAHTALSVDDSATMDTSSLF